MDDIKHLMRSQEQKKNMLFEKRDITLGALKRFFGERTTSERFIAWTYVYCSQTSAQQDEKIVEILLRSMKFQDKVMLASLAYWCGEILCIWWPTNMYCETVWSKNIFDEDYGMERERMIVNINDENGEGDELEGEIEHIQRRQEWLRCEIPVTHVFLGYEVRK